MKTLGCFLLLAALCAAAPEPALAGDITLFGGFQHPGNLTLSAAGSSTPALTDPANVGVFGVRYKHGGFIGFEHSLAYAPNFIDSQSKAFLFNSNFIVHGPAPLVRPYVTAGLGAAVVSGTGLSDIGTKFAVNYGGGATFKLVGPLTGRYDLRGYVIPGVQSQTFRIFETSFGLIFSN
jgi:hypothetical protein